MQLGMIELGRMGANVARRLAKKGHECVVYTCTRKRSPRMTRAGATGAASPADLVAKMAAARAIG